MDNRRGIPHLRKRIYKGGIYAESKKETWDLGRFIKTLYFFNGPPSPEKVSYTITFFMYVIMSCNTTISELIIIH